MLMDPLRLLTAALLASLAIGVAFGPELRRAITRLRSRRVPDVVVDAPSFGAEPQQF